MLIIIHNSKINLETPLLIVLRVNLVEKMSEYFVENFLNSFVFWPALAALAACEKMENKVHPLIVSDLCPVYGVSIISTDCPPPPLKPAHPNSFHGISHELHTH